MTQQCANTTQLEVECILHVNDLRSFSLSVQQLQYSAEYCSEIFGFRPNTENPYSVQPYLEQTFLTNCSGADLVVDG